MTTPSRGHPEGYIQEPTIVMGPTTGRPELWSEHSHQSGSRIVPGSLVRLKDRKNRPIARVIQLQLMLKLDDKARVVDPTSWIKVRHAYVLVRRLDTGKVLRIQQGKCAPYTEGHTNAT